MLQADGPTCSCRRLTSDRRTRTRASGDHGRHHHYGLGHAKGADPLLVARQYIAWLRAASAGQPAPGLVRPKRPRLPSAVTGLQLELRVAA